MTGSTTIGHEDFALKLREKWREIPATRQERLMSAQMLELSDAELLDYWEECRRQTTTPEVRGWYHEVYADSFRNMKLADVGPGVGVDGIYFAERGARVTFVDIVRDNLKLIERVCKLKGIEAEYYFIEDFFSYDFANDFDVYIFIGSMHNAPFEFSRKQVAALMSHLRPSGRVVMLAYPKERYDACCARDFAEFGRMCDGERTPWAEWYDDEKIKKLFGPGFTLNSSRNFGTYNIEFNLFDLTKNS